MKSLPDLFMLISNFCLLCLSLLCSTLSFFSHSLSPPLFHPFFSPCLLSWPWISLLPGQRMQRLRGLRDQLEAHTGIPADTGSACGSG